MNIRITPERLTNLLSETAVVWCLTLAALNYGMSGRFNTAIVFLLFATVCELGGIRRAIRSGKP